MRVVGGKTGADGRLFAYLVWTVPGGPAEKMGLQQGDKVRNCESNNKKKKLRIIWNLWIGIRLQFRLEFSS